MERMGLRAEQFMPSSASASGTKPSGSRSGSRSGSGSGSRAATASGEDAAAGGDRRGRDGEPPSDATTALEREILQARGEAHMHRERADQVARKARRGKG